MIGLKMRLHGADEWEQITGSTSNSVIVVSRDISGPKLKTDSVDLNNIDGVLDFSAVTGIHYTNKSVKIKLRKIADSEYDFDSFRRKYLGEKIDFAFDDEPQYWNSKYYHVGNVLSISDNYSADFRTIELDIDAEPFKHPEIGKTTVTIPVYELSAANLLTGNEEILYGNEGQDGATTVENPSNAYKNSGGWSTEITYTGTPKSNDFKPTLNVKLPITEASANTYIYQYQSANGHVVITLLYENNSTGTAYFEVIELDEDHMFKVRPINGYTLIEVYAVLEANTQSGATFNNMWLAKAITPEAIENGDGQVNPVFSGVPDSSNGTAFVYVNGVMTTWNKSSESWSPNLILRKGENKVFVISYNAGIGNYATLTFERLVL